MKTHLFIIIMSGFLATWGPFGIQDMMLKHPLRTFNPAKASTIKSNVYIYLAPTLKGGLLGPTQGEYLNEPLSPPTVKLETLSPLPISNQDGHVEGLALCASISFLSGVLLLVKVIKEQSPGRVHVQRGASRHTALARPASQQVIIKKQNYLSLMTFWTNDLSESPQSATSDNSLFLKPSLPHKSIRVGRHDFRHDPDSQLPGSVIHIAVKPDSMKPSYSPKCPNPVQAIIYSLVSYIVCFLVCFFVRIWFLIQTSEEEQMASNLKRTGKSSATSTVKLDIDTTKKNDCESFSGSGNSNQNVDISSHPTGTQSLDKSMGMTVDDKKHGGTRIWDVAMVDPVKHLEGQQSSQNQERNKRVEKLGTRRTRRQAMGKALIQNVLQPAPEGQDKLNTLSAEYPLLPRDLATFSSANHPIAAVRRTTTGLVLPKNNPNAPRKSEFLEPSVHESQSDLTFYEVSAESIVKSQEIPIDDRRRDDGTICDFNVSVESACLAMKEMDYPLSSEFLSSDLSIDSDSPQNGSNIEEHDAWSQVPMYFPDHINPNAFSGRFGPPDSPIVGILTSRSQHVASWSTDLQVGKRQLDGRGPSHTGDS